MQRVAVLILVASCALTAPSLAKDTNDSKPPSPMSSAASFQPSSEVPTPKPTTNSTTKAPTPKTTTNSTTKAPTPKPTTNSTTKAPTPKPTTNSTTKAPTPKPTTNSTTKAPTPKPTTNSTTKAPTPKPTTPKTTPTAAPQPTAAINLTEGNYNLTDKGAVCLMAQMALKIKLSSQKDNGTFIINPNQTNTSGECKETKANLTLIFPQGFITFLFNKSVASNSAYLNAVSFSLSYPLTKSGSQIYSEKNDSVHLFAAKIGHSYSCKDESVFMGNGLSLEVSNNRLQAFNVTKNDFGSPDPCPADQPDYRIAIAVGVTLLVLIVIVLIVYLLGRRKRTAGYQSL